MNNSTKSRVTCGIDIGYGNLKAVCTSPGGENTEIVMPAGAAPLSAMPRRSDSTADLKGGQRVTVKGEWWASGVEQIHIQNRARMTHEDYPLTDEYHALFLGGLAGAGARHIDLLVTGLPVSQFYSPKGAALKQAIVQRMTGKHFVNDDLQTLVDRVMVVPQPMGTFFGIASEKGNEQLVTDDGLRTLVIDPGFFSVDWVMMSGRSVLDQSSSTSTLATSVILERAAALVSNTLGVEVSRDQLDKALRNQRRSIPIGLGESADFGEALGLAIGQTVPAVIGEIRTSLRNAGPINLIILTGGGADLYESAVRAAFPKVKVVTPVDNVLGNARGYSSIAKVSLARTDRATAGA